CFGYTAGCIERIYPGRAVTCVQNAVIGRESEWAELTAASRRLKLVVVGGGAAGVECARVARMRGHEVVLFEKGQELGGQTRIARAAPLRGDFDGACRWAAQQCRKLGVEIRLGVEAGADTILTEAPDVVAIA